MPNRPRLVSFIVALSSLLLALGLAVPAGATQHGESEPGGDRIGTLRSDDRARARAGFSVYHGPVVVTLTDASSDGHQLGDLRVTSVPTMTKDGTLQGRLDATLMTTAVDISAVGDEIRISSLVFSFGDDGKNQIVVGGTATYPAQGGTVAIDSVAIRPILGGSGRFARAAGSAQTKHLDDDTWIHTFMLQPKASNARVGLRAATPERIRGLRIRLREGLRILDVDGGDKAEKVEAFPELKATQDAAKAAYEDAKAAYRAANKEANANAKAARKAEKEARSKADGAAITVVDDPDSTDAAPEEVGITRIDLGVALPGTAPGEQLGLWQYAIPAGSELVPHTHPGWQIARIARGELEYRVIEGLGTIIHSDGSSTSIGPGVHTLETGDSVVENPDLVHQGANRTDDEVIIIAATLYREGAPLAIPVEDSPVEEPAASSTPAASPANSAS